MSIGRESSNSYESHALPERARHRPGRLPYAHRRVAGAWFPQPQADYSLQLPPHLVSRRRSCFRPGAPVIRVPGGLSPPSHFPVPASLVQSHSCCTTRHAWRTRQAAHQRRADLIKRVGLAARLAGCRHRSRTASTQRRGGQHHVQRRDRCSPEVPGGCGGEQGRGVGRETTRVSVGQPERLRALLAPYGPLEAVVETSPAWPWLYELLTGWGITLVLAQAKRRRTIAESDYRNDRLDTVLLARMPLAGLIPRVFAKPREPREQAALVRHRVVLVRQRTALFNRTERVARPGRWCWRGRPRQAVGTSRIDGAAREAPPAARRSARASCRTRR